MLVPKIIEIQKRRTHLNLLKSELSAKAGLPKNAILRIESTESNTAHPLRAREIARALNCKVSDIFDELQPKQG